MAYTVKADLDGDAAGAFETNWSAYLMAMTIRRGRQSSLQEQQPSTLQLVLNNADGRFSPDKGTYSGLDHFKRVQVKEGARYRFTGWITNFGLDPHISRQQAIITCTDMLGMAQNILISIGNIIDRTADLVLNRVLDLMEAGEYIENHGCEEDTTDYSAVLGSTLSRETTAANVFEGEGSLKVITPNAADKEGVEYDLADEIPSGGFWATVGFLIKGTASATMRVCTFGAGVENTMGGSFHNFTLTGDWQFVKAAIHWATGMIGSSDEGVRIRTVGQQAVTFYLDGFHLSPFRNRIERSLDTGLTTLNRVSFGEERADVALRKVVDSEPGLFWFDGQGQFIFKNRDRQFGNAAANFGYEMIGTVGVNVTYADNKLVCKQTLRVDGYVESVTIYCQAFSGTANVRAVIYDDDSGPDALVALADEANIDTTLEWKTFTFPFPIKLAAGDYWLGLHVDAQVDVRYSAGTTEQDKRGGDTYSDGTENPFGSVYASYDRENSIYVSYRYADPELTWSDDGVGEKYQGLDVNQDARERIRYVRIRSQGEYSLTETGVTKIWEYEQVPFTIPPGYNDPHNHPGCLWRFGVEMPSPFKELVVSVTPAPGGNQSAAVRSFGDYFRVALSNIANDSVWTVTALSVSAKTYSESLEEGIYEYEAEQADPWVYLALNIEMPFLGKGESENAILGEAARLGGKHVNRLVRTNVLVRPDTSAYLTDLFGLELRDCVNLENKTVAQALSIDENCWVEGYQEYVTEGGMIQEFTFYVEEV